MSSIGNIKPKKEITQVVELWDVHKNYISDNKNSWIFRGLTKEYPLQTALERAIIESGRELTHAKDIECGFLKTFKRHASKYLTHQPNIDDDLAWLALMQHYGTPTRLLDWTYSFFVGVFFAIAKVKNSNDPQHDKDCCVIWALNAGQIREAIKRAFPTEDVVIESPYYVREIYDFKKIFRKNNPLSLVCPLNPIYHNERSTIQQGVFLCPGNVEISFEDNLTGLFPDQADLDDVLHKYTIKINTLSTNGEYLSNMIRKNLFRMNLTDATLFPGLEGFAKSLRFWLAFPDSVGMLYR